MPLVSCKPLTEGSLRGIAAIELPIGLKIHDVPTFLRCRKAWAALRSNLQLEKGGQKLDATGKTAYTAVLEWRDRGLADWSSAVVVELVCRAHPEALREEGSP